VRNAIERITNHWLGPKQTLTTPLCGITELLT
jgi:hypothetical protein